MIGRGSCACDPGCRRFRMTRHSDRLARYVAPALLATVLAVSPALRAIRSVDLAGACRPTRHPHDQRDPRGARRRYARFDRTARAASTGNSAPTTRSAPASTCRRSDSAASRRSRCVNNSPDSLTQIALRLDANHFIGSNPRALPWVPAQLTDGMVVDGDPHQRHGGPARCAAAGTRCGALRAGCASVCGRRARASLLATPILPRATRDDRDRMESRSCRAARVRAIA